MDLNKGDIVINFLYIEDALFTCEIAKIKHLSKYSIGTYASNISRVFSDGSCCYFDNWNTYVHDDLIKYNKSIVNSILEHYGFQ